MIRMLWWAPLLSLLLPPALEAQAPLQPAPIIASQSHSEAVPLTRLPAYTRPDVGPHRVAVTAVGGAGGFVAGALVGMLAAGSIVSAQQTAESFPGGERSDPFRYEGHEFAAAYVAMAIGAVGGTVGAPLGAHLANGRRGNPWLGVLGAAAATTGTVLLMDVWRDRNFPLVLPLAVVSTSTAVEILTTR